MSARNVIAVGASAGGVEALVRFVRELPGDLPAAVAVVLHMAPGGTSVLAGILDRSGPLSATNADDDQPLDDGRIYVARPDRHLLCDDGVLKLDPGPRENGHRPAVDPLFRSAADAYGPRTIAVILSGARDDGTIGAAAVRAANGRIAVQDPEDALYPSMPESVLARIGADATDSAAGLAGVVSGWCREADVTPASTADSEDGHEAGEPGSTGLTCPECGGAIWLDEPAGVPQLACHTGHVYTPDAFADEQERMLETALWGAVRRLDERAALLRRLAARIDLGTRSGRSFNARAEEAESQSGVIRGLIARRVAEAE